MSAKWLFLIAAALLAGILFWTTRKDPMRSMKQAKVETFSDPELTRFSENVLSRIRERSASGIYNHPTVAEVVGAGFELVMGMLDIFVPCISEIDREKCGGAAASSRSRRISAMFPEMLHHSAPGSAYCRLLGILDFISGMTDRNAVSLYQKLKGISL